VFAFVMMVMMFSLAGIPPTVGFYAKLAVLDATVNAGLTWLAVLAVVTSLIGAFYYLRVVKLMYFDAPQDASPIVAGGLNRSLLAFNGLAVLVLGIVPGPLMSACLQAISHTLPL
jgi:NADH-quinone oxidoreductase subunit N